MYVYIESSIDLPRSARHAIEVQVYVYLFLSLSMYKYVCGCVCLCKYVN